MNNIFLWLTKTFGKASLAEEMLKSIPQNAREIFEAGHFGGGGLVELDSMLTRPSYKDWAYSLFGA